MTQSIDGLDSGVAHETVSWSGAADEPARAQGERDAAQSALRTPTPHRIEPENTRPQEANREPRPEPPAAPATRIGRALAITGGMRPELIDEFPGERRDFVQMAVILFVTAIEAFLSGAFAINMAFTVPNIQNSSATDFTSPALWILLVAGAVWAFMIFSIDRYMVLGMEGLHRHQLIIPVILRLILAVMIGVVMSTPLVLQVFTSEIQQELSWMAQEQSTAAGDSVSAAHAALQAAQEKVTKAQSEITAARATTDSTANEAYMKAQDRYQQAQEDCATARNRATLEYRGQLPKSAGGSGTSGDGKVYQELTKLANQLCADARAAQSDRDEAKKATQLTPEQVQQRVQTAEQALQAAQKVRDDAKATYDLASARATEIGAGSWGLMSRLEALDRLNQTSIASGRNTGALTHWAILGLLLALELLPVVFKTAKQWNSDAHPYEQRWQSLDSWANTRAGIVQTNAESVLRVSEYAPVAQAADLQFQQQAANAYLAEELVGVQVQVMRNIIHDWAADHGVDYQPGRYTPPGRRPEPPPADLAAPSNDVPQDAASGPATTNAATRSEPDPAMDGWQVIDPLQGVPHE